MVPAVIEDPVLVDRFSSMHPDGMTVFILGGGSLRGAFFHGTRFVNRMRAQHSLGLLETMVLGQAALCGALLIPTMKGRDRVLFRYDTSGPAAGFSVEASSVGTVRGFLLQDPIPIDSPPESWDLSPYFGEGTVTVIRSPEGGREPVTGTVGIKHRNIAKDLAEYFLVSEQTATAFNTGIQFDREGRVIGAGGLFLQTMPGADPELVERAERAFAAAPSLGQWFAEGGDREDIIYGLFRGMEPVVALERDIAFDCPCSRDVYRQRILALNSGELEDILKNGPDPVEIVCHNCSSVYTYTTAELREERDRTRA
jgi:molecular chaperone Hsp33